MGAMASVSEREIYFQVKKFLNRSRICLSETQLNDFISWVLQVIPEIRTERLDSPDFWNLVEEKLANLYSDQIPSGKYLHWMLKIQSALLK